MQTNFSYHLFAPVHQKIRTLFLLFLTTCSIIVASIEWIICSVFLIKISFKFPDDILRKMNQGNSRGPRLTLPVPGNYLLLPRNNHSPLPHHPSSVRLISRPAVALDLPAADGYIIYGKESLDSYRVSEAFTIVNNDSNDLTRKKLSKHCATCDSCSQPLNAGPVQCTVVGSTMDQKLIREIVEHSEYCSTASSSLRVTQNSCNSKISQPVEAMIQPNLPESLKEEQEGEELALPSPRTLNDMMSKIQSKPNFITLVILTATLHVMRMKTII